jgi:hypothetical protein
MPIELSGAGQTVQAAVKFASVAWRSQSFAVIVAVKQSTVDRSWPGPVVADVWLQRSSRRDAAVLPPRRRSGLGRPNQG